MSQSSQTASVSLPSTAGPNPGTPPNEHPPLERKSLPDDAPNNDQRAPPATVATDASGSAEERDSSSSGAKYPPQRHAGKAGLGPHYEEQHRATLQDKIHGLKEVLEGQIKHDKTLQQQGHDRITGDLKERERKEKEKSGPFQDQKKTDEPAASPEHENKEHVPRENKDKEHENKA